MTPSVVVIELFFFVADAPANCLLRATVCSGQLFAPANCLLWPIICSGNCLLRPTGQLFVPAKSL